MVVVRFVPEAVWTAVVKLSVLPSSREVGVAGARVTFPGKRGGPALEPPPHPAMVKRAKIGNISQRPVERDLPMHSSSSSIHQTFATAGAGHAHESQVR